MTDDPSDDPVVTPVSAVPDHVLDELRGAFGDAADESADQADDERPTEPAPAPVAHVIQIGGDDLPDAAFLDEDGEDRLRSTHESSRGTILIGDADDGSTLDPTGDDERGAGEPATGAVPMDPRVRDRRIGVARAQGRRRLVRASIAAAIVLAVVAVFGVLASSLFRVDEVAIQGALYTDPEALAEIEDDLRGEPLLLVDTASIERRLEQLAWVELAQVGKEFPNTVRIDLRERQPVITFVGSDNRWRVADRDGRVLAVLDGQPAAPMLVAGVGPDTEVAQFAGSGYAAVAELVVSLPSEIRTITRTATLNPTTGDVGLIIDDDIVVALGQPVDLPAKLTRLLQTVRGGLDDVASIDVSTGEVSVTSK